MRLKLRTQTIIKEAFDNLPSGICYLDDRGTPILVNRQMHRLIFEFTGRDIQNISDFDTLLREAAVFGSDGTVWRFQRRSVGSGQDITEITAADITELYRRKQELEQSNAEHQDMMNRLEKAGQNIVTITRNEEILAMKMRIHNELAYALGVTRQFIAAGCSEEKKAEYIAEQKKVAGMLLGEIDADDEPDLFFELKQTAEKLGMTIVLDGELPDTAEALITSAVRECLSNTIRHADGDTVFVKTNTHDGNYSAVITNNGKPAGDKIVERGGLTALRKSIEEAGGAMLIESTPGFSMTITLPLQEEKEKKL